MFARHVTVKLKPGTLAEFTRVMDSEILPWLRKQKGFLDAITLAIPSGREIVSISFWDQEESAQDYNSTGYPEVLEILKKPLTLSVRRSKKSTFQKLSSPPLEGANMETARQRRIEHIVGELGRGCRVS
jgi:hypothetical protein